MIKKIIFTLAILFSGLKLFAQSEPLVTPYAVPIDTITKLITYEGVVELKGIAASDLYQRMNSWFHAYYKNPTEVIRENDSVKFSITGKPRFRIQNPADKKGLKTEGGHIQYTITVAARDGRYKYEITEFNWKQPSYYAVERWLDTKATSYQPAYNDYLQQLDKTALEVIASLKEAMSHEKVVKDKDTW